MKYLALKTCFGHISDICDKSWTADAERLELSSARSTMVVLTFMPGVAAGVQSISVPKRKYTSWLYWHQLLAKSEFFSCLTKISQSILASTKHILSDREGRLTDMSS